MDVDVCITAIERLTALGVESLSTGCKGALHDLQRLQPGDTIQIKCRVFAKSDKSIDLRSKALAELATILKCLGYNSTSGNNGGGVVIELVLGFSPGFVKYGIFESGDIRTPQVLLVTARCNGGMSIHIAQSCLSLIKVGFTTKHAAMASASTSFARAPFERALDGGLGELANKLIAAIHPTKEQIGEIAKKAHYAAVRRAAVEDLTDQSLLADIAKTDKDSDVRQGAVAKLTDQALLADLAVQAALAEVAKTAEDWSVRLATVEKLTDQKVLADIAKTDQDGSVRRAAEKRLKQLQEK
jgi:hypothetical protein